MIDNVHVIGLLMKSDICVLYDVNRLMCIVKGHKKSDGFMRVLDKIPCLIDIMLNELLEIC
uniref:Uncharacterized protein n=1 Tax=Helianthus annuus TaxID=4232 RepID=A0A251VF29_HELAN